MVPESLIWKYDKTLAIAVPYKTTITNLQNLMAHEFGHVLGLFDAYSYSGHISRFLSNFISSQTVIDITSTIVGDIIINPSANSERAGANDMMRNNNTVSPINITMVLWAWLRNKLQVYHPSILSTLVRAEESQTFFH
jgi:hypothetical protein